MSDITGRDRITALKDGEEIEIYNHASVSRHFYVNSINSYEEFKPAIAGGDSPDQPKPDYVTERLAETLYSGLDIDVRDHGIEVIDIEDDDVEVL